MFQVTLSLFSFVKGKPAFPAQFNSESHVIEIPPVKKGISFRIPTKCPWLTFSSLQMLAGTMIRQYGDHRESKDRVFSSNPTLGIHQKDERTVFLLQSTVATAKTAETTKRRRKIREMLHTHTHTHTGLLLIREWIPFAVAWMNHRRLCWN